MVGKKLEIKKDFNGVVEVIGLYPSGQLNYKEDHYQLSIAGQRLMLSRSLVNVLFEEVKPAPIPELAVKDVVEQIAKPKPKVDKVKVGTKKK